VKNKHGGTLVITLKFCFKDFVPFPHIYAKASASARPSMMEQHVLDSGVGSLTFAKLFNTLAQAFKSGQDNGGGAWAEVRVVKKKKMLRERMRKVMDTLLFEPILK
jgi:hypothetical protein